MRIGLQIPYFSWPGGAEQLGATFGDIARHAEDCGFVSLWVMDHFFQIPGVGKPDEDMLEGYTALAFAAARTSKIRLGTMVTGVTYRNPGVLVKTATTLDVLSGGRAYFGVGAAWFEREHLGLGVEFPPMKERFDRLEETLQIARQMWGEAPAPYEGTHYRLAETLCVPRPLSQPRPPILVGGRGETKTLRLVAEYADASNISTGLDDDGAGLLGHKYDVLRQHCAAAGRNFDEVEKTTLSTLWMTPDRGADERWLMPEQALERLAKFRAAGVDHAIFNMPDVDRPETLEYVAKNVVEPAAKL